MGEMLGCSIQQPKKPEMRMIEKQLQERRTHVLVVTNIGSSTPNFSEANIEIEGAKSGEKLASVVVGVPQSFAIPNLLRRDATPITTYAQMPSIEELPVEATKTGPIQSNTQNHMYSPLPQYQQTGKKKYKLNDCEEFNVQTARSTYEDQNFCLRKKETNAPWTVHYWVENDTSWEANNTIRQDDKVGQQDIENIAAKFSAKNMILDTSIDIYGKPWGSHADRRKDLISGDRTDLHVLIYDINQDGADGTIRGYFWFRDNFIGAPNSNEKLIITIDAPSLSRKKNLTYRVFIHEFNHMISFYQKQIVKDSKLPETWLSEMMAQMATDLLSARLFNGENQQYTDMIRAHLSAPWESLTKWDGKVEDYYSVSHFGAHLLRNEYARYGEESVQLARFIQNNHYPDYRAITWAIRQRIRRDDSWSEILKEYANSSVSPNRHALEATTANGKQFTLSLIQAFELAKNDSGIPIGIPMFDISEQKPQKMPYFFSSGKRSGYVSRKVVNQIRPPEPGGFIYVHLGQFSEKVLLKVNLPKQFEYDIVTL